MRARVAWASFGCAMLACAAWLAVDAVVPSGGRGFEERRWQPRDGRCEPAPADARVRIVREPALLVGRESGDCVSWESTYLAPQRARLQLELDASVAFELSFDDRVVLTNTRGEIRDRIGVTELDRGLHHLRLSLIEGADTSSYLRLQALDLMGPRPWGVPPPDLDEWYWRTDHAELDHLPRRSAFGLLMFVLMLAAGIRALVVARRPRSWSDFFGRTDEAKETLLVLLVGVLYFVPPALAAGISMDELAYIRPGANYVANLLLGDFTTRAWRWNMEHPPLSKWIYGAAYTLGGMDGARASAGLLAALTVACVFAATRALSSRRVAIVTVLVLLSAPPFVALLRTCTLEATTCAFAGLQLVVLAETLRRRRERSSLRSHVAAALAAALPVFGALCRATSVWWCVLSFLVYAALVVRTPSMWKRVPAFALGGALAVALGYLGWPWLWPDPSTQFAETAQHFLNYDPHEIYRGEFVHVGPEYFAHAFLATTPDAFLVLALVGAIALRARNRSALLLFGLAAILPFAQSVSHVRQDLARYVITAWLGVGPLVALGIDWLARVLSRRLPGRPPAAAVVPVLAVLALAPAVAGLARSLPYPRTYFAAWTGGAEEVERTRLFEIADWCEGLAEATAYVNAHAEEGDAVEYRTSCRDLHPPLRGDLRERAQGGWLVSQSFAYELEGVQVRCPVRFEVRSSGVVIARVWDCR